MELLSEIAGAWSWKGFKPRACLLQNDFGNVIFVDDEGRYWRICPETVSCDIVADDAENFERLLQDTEFQIDWRMDNLVEMARASLGHLAEGRCYCLKITAILGGGYSPANFGSIDRRELIGASGDLAKQIEGLPDGAKVRFRIAD